MLTHVKCYLLLGGQHLCAVAIKGAKESISKEPLEEDCNIVMQQGIQQYTGKKENDEARCKELIGEGMMWHGCEEGELEGSRSSRGVQGGRFNLIALVCTNKGSNRILRGGEMIDHVVKRR
jgi:hypothetical protein